MAIPKPLSEGEELFALQCKIYELKPLREYQFCKTRKWRFDFAFPDYMTAVEIEGGTWGKSRHTTGKGYEKDLEKYNFAAMRGWYVYRFTPKMVKSGNAIDLITLILGAA